MKPVSALSFSAFAAFFIVANTASAEITVKLKGVHLCCIGCQKHAEKSVSKVKGVEIDVNRGAKIITIIAKDAKSAKKALNQLKNAGFYGKSDNDKLAIKPGKALKEKVERAVIAGAHNCCGLCCKTIKELVSKVDGVAGVGIKPKQERFVVEGNFSPAAVISALNNAGFSAHVAKGKD